MSYLITFMILFTAVIGDNGLVSVQAIMRNAFGPISLSALSLMSVERLSHLPVALADQG